MDKNLQIRRQYYQHELMGYIWEKLEEEALPIKIRVDAEEMFPMFNQKDIIDEMNDLQYHFLEVRHCANVGHFLDVKSAIGPESGTEYLQCTRCGWSDTIIWY